MSLQAVASVQVVENWALIRAKIGQIRTNPEITGYMVVTVEVIDVSAVEGWPNLFDWAKGRQIAVNIPASTINEMALGPADDIVARIRKAGPATAFADPRSIVKLFK